MRGELFVYNAQDRLVAFESSPDEGRAEECIILVGGMTDGLLALPYTEALGEWCMRKGLSLVQPLFSSSYAGFGISSLDRDACQLAKLLDHLQVHRPTLRRIVLLGHSTGCQDILLYLARYHQESHRIHRALLQAPVSDRDYMFGRYPHADDLLSWAQEQCAKGKSTAVHRELYDGMAPINAHRLRSLLSRLGEDDYFSLDLSLAEREERVRTIKVPITMIVSGKDEFYPAGQTAKTMHDYYASFSLLGWEVKILPEADHAISCPNDQALFLDYLACRLDADDCNS